MVYNMIIYCEVYNIFLNSHDFFYIQQLYSKENMSQVSQTTTVETITITRPLKVSSFELIQLQSILHKVLLTQIV